MLGNMTKASRYLLLACCFLSVFSCTTKEPELPVKLSSVRPSLPGTKVVELEIPRDVYIEALSNQKALQRLRLVPLLRSAQFASPIPEYRLFDIEEGSAPAVLGLRNSDVLISANDFILYDAQKFKAYLMLLRNENNAEIEIRRGEEHLLFKYLFK